MDAQLPGEPEGSGLGGLASEAIVVGEVGHHHVDGLDIAEPGRLSDLGPGGGYLGVARRADPAQIGHVVLRPEVAPSDPGVGGDRAGIDHAGHRLQAGGDGQVVVPGTVQGDRHSVDGSRRLQLGDGHPGQPGWQAVQDVAGEVPSVGSVNPDEQPHLFDQRRRHLLGHRPGFGLAVGRNGVLKVNDGRAGRCSGQLGQDVSPNSRSEQQASHGEVVSAGRHGADATDHRLVDPDQGGRRLRTNQAPAKSRAMEATSSMAPVRSATSTSVAPSVARKQRRTRRTGRPVAR